eukprot:TRINITY_DN12178_c0_g1_i2.p1 TRINITY_DN12178_c0_g1~~TRINITY_DN12178_c0_g1_i2.p1  ORF type:complete len:1397 (+),score=290.99 TRINITY_DN12178_c0_g1_i2:1591-5781(+)
MSTSSPSVPPPSAEPSSAPVSPGAAPTGSPSAPGHTSPPSTSPVQQCRLGEIREGSGECVACAPGMVSTGCPSDRGGYPAPTIGGDGCYCHCRFHWTGADCAVCPPGLGGADCDRCAAPTALPPRCVAPPCADPASLPAAEVAGCGSRAKGLPFALRLHHEAMPVTVRIEVSSARGAPLVRFPRQAPHREVGNGVWEVEGVERQLADWLQLSVLPEVAMEPMSTIDVRISVTADGCESVQRHTVIRCPAPTPRVAGALPGVVVHEGRWVDVPCPLPALVHIEPPLSVSSKPSGLVFYSPQAETCTVASSGWGVGQYDVVVHVSASSAAEHEAGLNITEVGQTITASEIIGDPPAVAVHDTSDQSVVVAVSSEAVESTFFVRLKYAHASGASCSVLQSFFVFWGPEWTSALERTRVAVGKPFEFFVAAHAMANVGSPPWCPEPPVSLVQQLGGLSIAPCVEGVSGKEKHSRLAACGGSQWVLRGTVTRAGVQFVYLAATDCHGGRAVHTVELEGIIGTVLDPVPDVIYLEDTPTFVTPPRIISTSTEVTLLAAPRAAAQLWLGNLSAECAPTVHSDQDPAKKIALRLSGPPDDISACRTTLFPPPDDCSAQQLLWVADQASALQLLRGVCSPDPPVATNVTIDVRWDTTVEQTLVSLLRSTDAGGCVDYSAAPRDGRSWLSPTSTSITGIAPSYYHSTCIIVHGYACRTVLYSTVHFCANAVPDLRAEVARYRDCTEDVPCPMDGAVALGATSFTTDDRLISLMFLSSPPVMQAFAFANASAAAGEVRPMGDGVLFLSAPFRRIAAILAEAQIVTLKDFNGEVTVAVRGAMGTKLWSSNSLILRVAPANDAPFCKEDSCKGLVTECHVWEDGGLDLSEHFSDSDNDINQLKYWISDSSAGVRIQGSSLLCSHPKALADFFDISVTGSVTVAAEDPGSRRSVDVVISVEYVLSPTERTLIAIFFVLISALGVFPVIFNARTKAMARELMQRAACAEVPHGVLFAHVAPVLASALREARLPGVAVRSAACMNRFELPESDVPRLIAAAGVRDGPVAVCSGRNVLAGVCSEGAVDAAVAQPCIMICPAQLGGAACVPHVSVAHSDDDKPLSLTLRVRPMAGAAGGCQCGLEYCASYRRVLPAALSAGEYQAHFTGTQQQLTAWAGLQRLRCAPGARAELVVRLGIGAGSAERALMHAIIPINAADNRAVIGAGDPPPPGGGAAPSPVQQQQQGPGAGRFGGEDNDRLDFNTWSRVQQRADLEQRVQQLQVQVHRLAQVQQSQEAHHRRAQQLEEDSRRRDHQHAQQQPLASTRHRRRGTQQQGAPHPEHAPGVPPVARPAALEDSGEALSGASPVLRSPRSRRSTPRAAQAASASRNPLMSGMRSPTNMRSPLLQQPGTL